VFTHAIVRLPGTNFAQGLTSVQLGVPLYDRVLQQHAHYCDALRACGLTITTLDADLDHPDSTFVEDTAVVTAHSAILTRPGARSREGSGGNSSRPELLLFRRAGD
jgi:dimethylargininase